MGKVNDGGAAFPCEQCQWCGEGAYIKQGHIWLCKKHYRFSQMRTNAKRHSKTVPSYLQLEKLYWLSDMRCAGCGEQMVWLSKENSQRVVSLQHDRSGEIRFLCRACNTRHASFKDDSFYTADPTKRKCPRCNKELPLERFSTDRSSRWKNKSVYCRRCSAAYYVEWVAQNREEYNEKRREYYHKRKADGNPIPRQSP